MPKTKTSHIFYEETGNGEPIILISGLGADRLFWTKTVEGLKSNYRVITIDNRGSGNTGIIGTECSTDVMALDVLEVMDEIKLSDAHIIEHSLGGCIAQKVAIQFPHRVKKLVLCSTLVKLPSFRKFQMQNHLEMMTADVKREFIVKNVFSWYYSFDFFDNQEMVDFAIKISLAKPLEETRKNYFYQVKALFEHDTSEELSKISMPTLGSYMDSRHIVKNNSFINSKW